MKTPRELLLERHRAQVPALDEIRARVVTKVGQVSNLSPASVSERPRATTSDLRQLSTPSSNEELSTSTGRASIEEGDSRSAREPTIRSLSAPAADRRDACPTLLATLRRWLTFNRAAWSALTAGWCVIIGLNVAASATEGPVTTIATATVNSGEVLANLRDYRAQLALLLNDPADAGEEVAKPESKNRPRSDADRVRKGAFHFQTAFA